MNLRALAEKDLGLTLEGDWSSPVTLIAPDGVRYSGTVDGRPLTGQVLYEIVRDDLERGEKVTYDTPVVSLRRSSLARVPQAGEPWGVIIPSAPVPGAPTLLYVLSPMRPPEGGASIGYIKLYLQNVEQTPDEEEAPA